MDWHAGQWMDCSWPDADGIHILYSGQRSFLTTSKSSTPHSITTLWLIFPLPQIATATATRPISKNAPIMMCDTISAPVWIHATSRAKKKKAVMNAANIALAASRLAKLQSSLQRLVGLGEKRTCWWQWGQKLKPLSMSSFTNSVWQAGQVWEMPRILEKFTI